MANQTLTQKRLKEVLDYNPDTGTWLWRDAANGIVAGYLHNDGYVRITVDNCLYLMHRLAFLYMSGEMPTEVDHKNHIRNDNRWENLHPSSRPDNAKNQSMPINNTSGSMGVYWNEKRNKWQAQIGVSDKNIYLGRFNTIEEATIARKCAEVKYGFHENHGSEGEQSNG